MGLDRELNTVHKNQLLALLHQASKDYPLQNVFPDFECSDSTSVARATEYIVNRFKSLIQLPDDRVRVHILPDLATDEDIRVIDECIREAYERPRNEYRLPGSIDDYRV